MGYLTPKEKIDQIRRCYINGVTNQTAMHRKYGLHKTTVRKFIRLFREIERLYPHKLKDFSFMLPQVKKIRPETKLHKTLIAALPGLLDKQTTKRINIIPLWETYRASYPDGYYLSLFTQYFIAWRRANNVCLFSHRRIKEIHPDQTAMLTAWRNSDNQHWKRAVVILGSLSGKPVKEMATQVERSQETVLRWIENFKEKGIEGLIDPPKQMAPERKKAKEDKEANLMKLMHETPQLHGFNRTSWRIEDLATAYKKVYNMPMGISTAGIILQRMGYGYRKSREVLTSPDPNFREKLQVIKDILGSLGPKEKFFSVDEMGPLFIRKRGGRTFIQDGILTAIPQKQKNKGFIVCTAALELSTNQVTHFFSPKKNTDEMIKLIDILIEKYHDQEKLYISWDAAAWHVSTKLKAKLAAVNSLPETAAGQAPELVLAPLPASAQFLNVIESVFSGLCKAVIHNSDYNTPEECKAAITRHFFERNEHFLTHPKKAGNTIWGKERVVPVFDESKNFKHAKRTRKKNKKSG